MPPPTHAHSPPSKSAAVDPAALSVNNPTKAWESDSPPAAAAQQSAKKINVANAPVEALRPTPSVARGAANVSPAIVTSQFFQTRRSRTESFRAAGCFTTGYAFERPAIASETTQIGQWEPARRRVLRPGCCGGLSCSPASPYGSNDRPQRKRARCYGTSRIRGSLCRLKTPVVSTIRPIRTFGRTTSSPDASAQRSRARSGTAAASSPVVAGQNPTCRRAT